MFGDKNLSEIPKILLSDKAKEFNVISEYEQIPQRWEKDVHFIMSEIIRIHGGEAFED